MKMKQHRIKASKETKTTIAAFFGQFDFYLSYRP